MVNIPRLRAVFKHNAIQSGWTQHLAVIYCPYTTNPEVPYWYHKLVTNLIRIVEIHVLSNLWYTVRYTTAVSQSAFRLKPPSLYNYCR